MSCVKHSSTKGLVRTFQGSKRMMRGRIYMMLAKEKGADFFGEKIKLSFLDFHDN